MTLPRFAFAADYWGDRAVVCRALENRPGPIVDQQFGIFESWSHANSFATKLNEGLDLTPSNSRQIVTSATLAASSVLRAPVADRIWRRAPVLVAAEQLQWRSLLAQLDWAATFCKLSEGRSPNLLNRRTIRIIQNAFDRALVLVAQRRQHNHDLEQVSIKLEVLRPWLQGIPNETVAH